METVWHRICLFLILVSSVNADCDADIEAYFNGLNPSNPSSLQLWPLEMFDSSTKFITDGIFELSFLGQYGNFDQCIAVNGPADEGGKPRFTGQHCLFRAGLQLPSNADTERVSLMQQNLQQILNIPSEKTKRVNEPLPISLMWSVCAPSSCGLDGVKRVADFNTQFFANIFGTEANTTVLENSCYHEGSMVLDAGAWSFIAFASILVGFVLVSSIVDCLIPTNGWKAVFNAFSLKQNLNDLFKLPQGNTPGQLSCLHGMRTISMLWIVFCHSLSFDIAYPGRNFITTAIEFPHQWFMAPLLNGYASVDTFFLLSGLLTVYVPLKDHAKGRKFNVLKYYIYRYLRITIPLAAVIWFQSTATIYLGTGPSWLLNYRSIVQTCQENWWANLLYISNYFFTYCLAHTWYLCVDMQLALLAPLIIYPLMKWPKYGLMAISVLTLGSVAAVFAVTYTENLPWTSQLNVDPNLNARYGEVIYFNTPMRASPYLIGMALGYILSKNFHVPLPKWGIVLGWLISTTVVISVVFLILIPYSEGYVRNALEAAFYSSLHKLAWALGLSWMIWACVNGYGGFINKILSWKLFLPASKLTFCGYLMHILAIQLYSCVIRAPYFVSHIENWYLFSGILFLTLPYTVILYLAVEAPTMNLMRLAFKKERGSKGLETGRTNKTLGKDA